LCPIQRISMVFKLFLRAMFSTRAIHPKSSNWERLSRTNMTHLAINCFLKIEILLD